MEVQGVEKVDNKRKFGEKDRIQEVVNEFGSEGEEFIKSKKLNGSEKELIKFQDEKMSKFSSQKSGSKMKCMEEMNFGLSEIKNLDSL